MRNQFLIDASAKAFHIDGMHEKFRAGFGQAFQSLAAERELGEFLPAIGDHDVIRAAPTAAQVEDETIASDDADQLCEPIPIKLSIAKDPRRNDDMRRAGGEP